MTSIGERFRALHVPRDPLVMVNVWDQGTAKMMAALGAQALATSSAAHAYVMGRPDGGGVTRDEALAHAEEIVSATSLPVQGDFENGFGDDPATCAETVRLSAEVGLAGICIEDTMFPSGDAYDFDLAVERIRAGGRKNYAARGIRDRGRRMPAAKRALARARLHPGGVESRFECHGDVSAVAASGEGAHGIAPLVRAETDRNSGIVQCAASASEATRPKLMIK